jgi:hypothetical protein
MEFLVAEGKKQEECLPEVYGEATVGVNTVQSWAR